MTDTIFRLEFHTLTLKFEMIFINDNWLFSHLDPDVSYQSQALGRYDFVTMTHQSTSYNYVAL